MPRHPVLVPALVAATLSGACFGGSSADVVSTTRPVAAPFLGNDSTRYAGGPAVRPATLVDAPDAAAPDAGAPAAGAPAPAAMNAMREVARRARAEGWSGCLLVMRRGADTLSVEHVAREGRRMRASLSLPTDMTVEYTIHERADGTTETIEASITRFGDETPQERFWASFTGDSILSRTARRDHPTINGAYALPGSVLTYIESSPAMLEQMVRHARRAGRPATNLAVLVLGDPSVMIGGAIVFQGADSAIVTFGDMVTRLAVDGEGRVLGGLMEEDGVTIERVELDPRPTRAVARRQ